MTLEDKKLLLKDLCARLPYGVFVLDDMKRTYKLVMGNAYLTDLFYGDGDYVDVPIKPFLRPMSSMTKEERKEYELLANHCIVTSIGFIHLEATPLIEFFNENNFDYHGLIDKGLAIKVTEENNPYK